ncbi:class I SAM-dependent methyltransferase [Luteimonas sp. RD2P54]|uniref:Class I SAM-dependent methyltransferase n=1 Tax=Luteimonas endophytica TaxID=3042023 RepID=A0ABT6JFN3_9GAMM|nr:class I SAM-dependent methyltransferase [Luteimonas endophytica]MDH5824983.1 class I SAM-dependent methyltransferase [Luteimonas endophytica]
MASFDDPAAVANYLAGPVAKVPGLLALHRMAELLLAEAVPGAGRVLVLGAGGGLELRAFAAARPQWRLVGVDPSAAMLALAATTLGDLAPRVELIEGYVDAAPTGPFDGAACLLTLHFLEPAERLRTLRALRRRLRPGAPLVVAHHSFDTTDAGKQRWLRRYAAFASPSGTLDAGAEAAIAAMRARLPVMAPEAEVALLEEAGFAGVELFYAGFTFRGWVAYRA